MKKLLAAAVLVVVWPIVMIVRVLDDMVLAYEDDWWKEE